MDKTRTIYLIFFYVISCSNYKWKNDKTLIYIKNLNKKRQKDDIYQTYWKKYSKVKSYW